MKSITCGLRAKLSPPVSANKHTWISHVTCVNSRGVTLLFNMKISHVGPGTRPSVAMLPTGPLQEPRLPHLRNCQNLTEYFITWIGHGGCSSHGQVWQILDCLPDDKSQLSETCRLHSICGACFLPPSQQKRLGLAFRGPSPGRKGPRFHNLNICRPSQQAEITALAEQPPSPSDPFRTFLWKKLGNSRHNEKSKQ